MHTLDSQFQPWRQQTRLSRGISSGNGPLVNTYGQISKKDNNINNGNQIKFCTHIAGGGGEIWPKYLRTSRRMLYFILNAFSSMIMKRKVKIALTVIIISCATLSVGLMAYISYMGLGCIIPEDCPPLEFPIAGGAQNITDFNGFNITNWGAPGSYHNGMDLVTTGHNWTSIVAAAPGQVIAISETPNPNSNPPGATMFGISVRVGCRWVVIYNMEPVAYLESQRALQRQEIYVKVGDQVTQGETIARL